MGCLASFIKYFLCFFNFIFFIAGGAAFAIGMWLLIDSSSFTNLISEVNVTDILMQTNPTVIKWLSSVLLIAGALIFVVSFLGYCGAMFESKCFLGTYGSLVPTIFVLECVAIGLAFGLKESAIKGTQDFLKSTIEYYGASEDKAEIVTVTWNRIMTEMHCCGVEDYRDFQRSVNWTGSGNMVPEACCVEKDGVLGDPTCPISPNHENSYFQEGCYSKLVDTLTQNKPLVIGVGVALGLVEILVTVMALYLACFHQTTERMFNCWWCCC